MIFPEWQFILSIAGGAVAGLVAGNVVLIRRRTSPSPPVAPHWDGDGHGRAGGMVMAKPTPRPWHFDGCHIQTEARIICEMGVHGVRLSRVDQANAALIVDAVNAPDAAALAASHAELLAALTKLLDSYIRMGGWAKRAPDPIRTKQARAAIARAEAIGKEVADEH